MTILYINYICDSGFSLFILNSPMGFHSDTHDKLILLQ